MICMYVWYCMMCIVASLPNFLFISAFSLKVERGEQAQHHRKMLSVVRIEFKTENASSLGGLVSHGNLLLHEI